MKYPYVYNKNHICPACACNNKYANKEDGKVTASDAFYGCEGKKNIFRKWKCPSTAHLHIKCWACKLKYLMWSPEMDL